MPTRKTTLFYVVLIAVASAAVGMVISSQWGLPQASSAQTVTVPPGNSAPLGGPIDATTFRNIAKNQAPVVVNIRTSGARAPRGDRRPSEDMLRRFFGQQTAVRAVERRAKTTTPIQQGAGTGFIIDKAASSSPTTTWSRTRTDIQVGLFGANMANPYEHLYAAKVVGRDTLTDSALIQLTEMPSTAAPGSQVRRLRSDAARRLGDGDRQSLQLEPHGDRRRRVGARPPRSAGSTRGRKA